MKMEVFTDDESTAQAAAKLIAEESYSSYRCARSVRDGGQWRPQPLDHAACV